MIQQIPIQLLVGLGNPGPEYTKTRHNAGAWFIDYLLSEANTNLQMEKKFQGLFGQTTAFDHSFYCLIPMTYMNLSGQSVLAAAKFYKIPPQAILVIHDDLDLPTGVIKLKQGGGHGGHNGLRDIMSRLGSPDFVRLRIGIGHPGHRDHVTKHVLSKASKFEKEQIELSISCSMRAMPHVLKGDLSQAMQMLHTCETS